MRRHGVLLTIAALFVGSLIGRLLDDDTGYWAFVAGGLGALFVLYYLLKPFFMIFKAFKLRNARLTLDGELVEGYTAPHTPGA